MKARTMDSAQQRLSRAQRSLEGLSVGDAFGEQYFMSFEMAARYAESGEIAGPPYDFTDTFIQKLIDRRELPTSPPWRWTDDTALAIEIVANLSRFGEINQDELARGFSRRYRLDPRRGYGGAMHSLLPVLAFEPWRAAASSLFNGSGSFGNGAAMRVAPIGAYFADDLDACVRSAVRSAEVTHSHPEGVAGAIGVTLAAAWAWRLQGEKMPIGADFLDLILPLLPDSEVKKRTMQARDFPDDVTGEEAADILGAGFDISAQDTVPFVLWCAAQHPDHFEEALWLTVSGLGDRDTTCAMVGGIVAAPGVIPDAWLSAREPLPSS